MLIEQGRKLYINDVYIIDMVSEDIFINNVYNKFEIYTNLTLKSKKMFGFNTIKGDRSTFQS